MTRPLFLPAFAVMFVSLMLQVPAQASLGLNSDSANQDCQNVNGTLKVVTLGQQLECKTPHYTLEFFLDSTGVIKTISWHGSMTPPLNSLLGSYSDEYEASRREQASAHAKDGLVAKNVLRASKQTSAHVTVTRNGNARHHYGSIQLK